MTLFRRRAIAVFASVLVVLAVPQPASAKPDPAGIDDAVARHLADTDTPGAALAVLDSNGIIHNREWGRDGNGENMTPDTPFLWGSVAKPVTATAVLQLAESGELDIEQPVNTYLDWYRPTYDGKDAAPTVAQLLTNTSGMSADADSAVTDRYDNSAGGLQRAARDLADVELFARPGDSYEYVSANYLLLGALIEEVTEQDFGDHLRAEVFDPLGMDSVITDAESAAAIPPGHRQYFGGAKSYGGPYDASGVSYGYMAGSVADLGRFALAELRGGEVGGRRILSAASVDESHKGRVATSSGQFGYGWEVGTLPGTEERMVWKPGATPGYHTMLILLPERDRAVVLAQNTYSEARALQLRNAAFDAVRLSIGHEPGPELSPDGQLLLAPWIAAALCLPLLLTLWTTWRGARRGTLSRSWLRRVGWAAIGAGIPVLLLVALPVWLKVSLSRLLLWAPDLGYTLIILSSVAIVATLWRFGLGIRHRRGAA